MAEIAELQRPICAQDWENVYPIFRDLWDKDLILSDIMRTMESEHRFRAT